MTRSEEELRVGTTQHERGRVRLRKYLTTEHVEQVLPVRRERVRLDKDTLTGEERVAEELRNERIEVDEDTRGRRHERRRRG
jgi:stress response protein YsnF